MTPLTAAHVRFIRAKLAEGKKQWEIAKMLKVHKTRISFLKRRHIDRMDLSLEERWREVHDIGGIGKRAAEETA